MPLRGLTMSTQQELYVLKNLINIYTNTINLLKSEVEELKAEKLIHDEAYLSQMKEIQLLKKEMRQIVYSPTERQINAMKKIIQREEK
jgi:hypothetical protein